MILYCLCEHPEVFSFVDMFIVSSESLRSGRFSSILLHGCSTRSKEHGFCLRHINYLIISDKPILEIFKSSFKQFVRLKIDGSELDSVASSVDKSSMQVCIDNDKSFIYTRKSKGPRTEP